MRRQPLHKNTRLSAIMLFVLVFSGQPTILTRYVDAQEKVKAGVTTGPISFFYSGGKRQELQLSARWEGVKFRPVASQRARDRQLLTLSNRASTFASVSSLEGAISHKEHNIVVFPVKGEVTPSAKNTLRAELNRDREVARLVRVFDNGNLPPIVETDEFLIQFKPQVTQAQANALLAQHGATIVRPLGKYAPNGYVARVVDRNNSSIETANALYYDPQVIFSHPNLIWPMAPQSVGHSTSLEQQATPTPSPAPSPTPVTSDPLYPGQWHLNNTGQGGGVAGADVKAEAAWTITRGNSNIIIAINDDGVDVSHEDLKDRIVPGWDFLDNDNDPSPAPDQPEERKPNNHGTACAGVAAATGNNGVGVTGVSPNARIMPLRILGNTVTAELWAQSFVWAADHGADIISNSWGPGKSEPTVLPDNIRAAIDYATEKGRGGRGCVILFAAGNYDTSVDVNGYAAYERVLSVGASTNQDRRADYSCFGSTLGVVAPSGGGTLRVVTTDRTGSVGYSPGNYTSTGEDGFSGTSSSTPLVAGIAALILSAEPNLTYKEVYERLRKTADPIDFEGGSYDRTGHSNLFGYGRVNALRALRKEITPIVTLISPKEKEIVGSNYLFRASTDNDSFANRVEFQGRLYSFSTGSSNLPIADADPYCWTCSTTVDQIEVQGPGVISNGTVTVNVQHTSLGDIGINLRAPDGQIFELLPMRAGLNITEFIQTYDLPQEFLGKPFAGTWKLEITDGFAKDAGTLVSWELKLYQPWTTFAMGSRGANNGEWSAMWNATNSPSGIYQIRALAFGSTGMVVSNDMRNVVAISPLNTR